MPSAENVCFLEEIAISNMYGTELEKAIVSNLVSYLINVPNDVEKVVELAVIIEEIKRREITHMDWNCVLCGKCERTLNCKIKWYRGERGMTQYCCSYCQSFEGCLAKFQKNEKSRRIISEIFIININGTDEEVQIAKDIVNNITNLDSLIKLSVLAEEIKLREFTFMKWNCCFKCVRYDTCRIKWNRGETNSPHICCSYCQNFNECLKNYYNEVQFKIKLFESIFIIGIYGNDEELKFLNNIFNNPTSPKMFVKLSALAFKIKNQIFKNNHL